MTVDTRVAASSVFNDREERIAAAARSVISLCQGDASGRPWRPKGTDEVAVLLESLGYSPEVVTDLWCADIFALAREVEQRLSQYVDPVTPVPRPPMARRAKQHLHEFGAGIISGSHSVIALVGLATFGAALWSTNGVSSTTGCAMLLGLYGAYVVTGCCAAAFSARLGFYVAQDERDLAVRIAALFARWTSVLFVTVGLVGWLAIASWRGPITASIALLFFLAVGLYQFWLTPLLVYRQYGFVVALAATLACAGGVTARFGFPFDHDRGAIVLASEVGLTALALAAASLTVLRRRAQTRKLEKVQLPTLRSLASAAAPYAAFGLTYGLAMLIDHVCAGLRSDGGFAYRSSYELGCNVAMLEVIPLAGLVNVVTAMLTNRLAARAATTYINEGNFARRATYEILIAGAVTILATGIIVEVTECAISIWLAQPHVALGRADFGEVAFCAHAAAFAYAPIGIILIGSHVLFALRRRWIPVGAASCAVVINLACGLVAHCLNLPPALSILGLGCGIAVAALITICALALTARRFDYWYYAAY